METSDQDQPTEMPEACKTSPMGRAVRLIGDTWILLIIINLLRGPKRYSELQASMGHISSKTLAQRLRTLGEMGLVQRQAFLEIPPRVEYHLTDKGQEFGKVIAAIEQFAQKNLSTLAVPDGLNATDEPAEPSLPGWSETTIKGHS